MRQDEVREKFRKHNWTFLLLLICTLYDSLESIRFFQGPSLGSSPHRLLPLSADWSVRQRERKCARPLNFFVTCRLLVAELYELQCPVGFCFSPRSTKTILFSSAFCVFQLNSSRGSTLIIICAGGTATLKERIQLRWRKKSTRIKRRTKTNCSWTRAKKKIPRQPQKILSWLASQRSWGKVQEVHRPLLLVGNNSRTTLNRWIYPTIPQMMTMRPLCNKKNRAELNCFSRR